MLVAPTTYTRLHVRVNKSDGLVPCLASQIPIRKEIPPAFRYIYICSKESQLGPILALSGRLAQVQYVKLGSRRKMNECYRFTTCHQGLVHWGKEGMKACTQDAHWRPPKGEGEDGKKKGGIASKGRRLNKGPASILFCLLAVCSSNKLPCCLCLFCV